jgi:hypothetical protein
MKYPLYDTEPGSATGGGGGVANPPPSQTQAAPVSPVDTKALEATVKELTAQVRALQSEKDKGVAKVSKEVQSLSEQFKQYEKLKARGLEPEEIVERMELQELLAERRGSKPSADVPSGKAGTQTQEASVNVTEWLPIMGLDANDPKVVQVLASGLEPMDQLTALRGVWDQNKKAQQQPPNAAQVMSAGAGTTTTGDTVDTLTDQMRELQKEPMKNYRKIQELSAKLRPLLPTK